MENDKKIELGDILIYQTEKGDTRDEFSTCKEFLQVPPDCPKLGMIKPQRTHTGAFVVLHGLLTAFCLSVIIAND